MVTKMCNAKHKFERLRRTKEEPCGDVRVQPAQDGISYKVRYPGSGADDGMTIRSAHDLHGPPRARFGASQGLEVLRLLARIG